MTKKLLKLQERTIKLIQHGTMRLAELNNILTIINFSLSETKPNVRIVEGVERRIKNLEERPNFAGSHENFKI